jgi:hypothetical protein
MNRISIYIFFILFLFSCQPKKVTENPSLLPPTQIHDLLQSLNDLIVYDIFSPPVASRIYAYATIASYEASRNMDTTYPSLANQLNGFPDMPIPSKQKTYDFRLSAAFAFFHIVNRLTFTKDSIVGIQEKIISELSVNISNKIKNNSQEFGYALADSILSRAEKDNYKKIQGLPRYTLSQIKGKWIHTPPDYSDAVQPYWNKMMPLVMDSASQFKPYPPPKYSKDKKSKFYLEMIEVYDINKKLNDSLKLIATFWDDNASATTYKGHLKYAIKKPSPGGHWINIAAIACNKAQYDWLQSSQVYALTSISMYDAFLSCWDEKYRSEYIRPVTAIQDLIDQNWDPFLQTPPFPEYTSGHSVVSNCIASVLTNIFGDNFQFLDNYEKSYIGIERRFTSINNAAAEATISRLYGGIHFRSAVMNGATQGKQLGKYINLKLNIKNTK